MQENQKFNHNKVWQALNPHKKRMNMLRWYYRNRKIINLMISKPSGVDDDEADLWIASRIKSQIESEQL